MRAKMIKRLLLFALVCAALTVFCPGASAQDGELYEKSGARGLYDGLDDETKELLRGLGVDEAQVTGGLSGEGIFAMISDLIRDRLSSPLKALAAVLGVAVLCRLGISEGGGAAQLVGAAACGLIISAPVLGLLTACQRVAQTAAAFLTAAAPVYAGLLVAGGNLATGSGYSFLAMLAGAAIPVLAGGIFLPLLQIYLGLSVAGAVSGTELGGLAQALYRLGKWALTVIVTLFAAIISVQTAVNAQIDAAAGKAAKLALSAGVPIVGGALGDAVAAIQNSVNIVKSGSGAFGMLAALCIFAPVMAECALWAGVCMVGKGLGELFEVRAISALMDAAAATVKMVLALLCSICAVCVVSAAAVLAAK